MLQKGFTLIELMIVVAIIGILSMFALPAYQDYTKRTYVSEGMALATAAKMASTEFYSTEGEWPTTNRQAGLPAANKITGQAVFGIGINKGKAGKPASGTAAASVTNINIFYNTKVVSGATFTGGATPSATITTGSNTLTIAPVLADANTVNTGSVEWACIAKGGSIEEKWLPANCRAQYQAQ